MYIVKINIYYCLFKQALHTRGEKKYPMLMYENRPLLSKMRLRSIMVTRENKLAAQLTEHKDALTRTKLRETNIVPFGSMKTPFF